MTLKTTVSEMMPVTAREKILCEFWYYKGYGESTIMGKIKAPGKAKKRKKK
jgi:hypothetical protein